MSLAPAFAALAGLLALAGPSVAHATAPIKVVEGTLPVPEGMSTAEALASVSHMADIFELYEPAVPKIPGVRLDLDKQILSASAPTIVELPVQGSAFGRGIEERARVTATATTTVCDDGAQGVRVNLDFTASSVNIERRIDRIEITTCPALGADDQPELRAVGRMYAGHMPEDPTKNALRESIGSRALQTAFIRQVPAVFTAIEAHWSQRAETLGDGLADPDDAAPHP